MKKQLLPLMALSFAALFSCKKVDRTVSGSSSENPLSDQEKSTGVSGSSEWDSNPYKVNVIYFIPTDLDTLDNFQHRTEVIMYDIQEFYAVNMAREGYGRRSFALDKKNGRLNIIMIHGAQGQAHYTNSNNAVAEINSYFATHPTEKKSEHSMVYIPKFTDASLSQPYSGNGKFCFVVDYPELGSTLLKGGGEAHELGHALNLPHNGETKSTKQTLGTALMGNGVYTYKDKPTFLTATDCAILSTTQALSTATRSDWYTPQSIDLLRGSATTVNNIFSIQLKFQPSQPVAKVVVYHDAKPYGGNLDYDALTFVGTLIGTDSVKIDCPLSDFFNTTAETQLRIKFVFENGSQVDKSMVYTFNANQPVVASFLPVAIVSGANYRLFTKLNNTSLLDVAGGGTTNGTRTLLWSATTPTPNNQLWKVTSVGNGEFKLQPQHAPTKTLEVAGNSAANYTQIQIGDYSGATGQRWKLQASLGGAYELIPVCAPNARADVANASSADGAKIQLFQANGNSAQQWRFEQQ